MKLPNILTEQHNLGVRFGALRILMVNVTVYVSMANFLMICLMTYSTTLRAIIQPYIPWFSFPIFIGAMVSLFLLAPIMEHKFVVPAVTSYTNAQWYKHQNLLKADLDTFKKELMDRLEEIEAKIGGTNNESG